MKKKGKHWYLTLMFISLCLVLLPLLLPSYLPGTIHIFSVRQQHPLSLHGALHGWDIPSSQAKQAGFGSVGRHGEKHVSQQGKDNNSKRAKIILRGFFPFEFPWVEVHLVTEAFWQCIMEALDDMALCCNGDGIRYLQRAVCATLIL